MADDCISGIMNNDPMLCTSIRDYAWYAEKDSTQAHTHLVPVIVTATQTSYQLCGYLQLCQESLGVSDNPIVLLRTAVLISDIYS